MQPAQDDDRIMSLVESALAQPPDQRENYLRSACRGDLDLFALAWDYVRWEHRMEGFLLDPLCRPLAIQHRLETGDLLDGRFRIVRELAQGGMGIVYEAVDERLGKRIALKCAKAGFHNRLSPEVRHASEISHPNVCRIFEIHTASTSHGEIDFFTMEFLDGETLTARLRRGRLPEAEADAIAMQLCQGLAEAHRHRVVHGDLKSNNVILTRGADGGVRAVITDFGLARGSLPQVDASDAPTAGSSEAGGTPGYMAPELSKGGKPTAASDVYALGVILCELSTGQRPFDEPTRGREGAVKPSRARSKWESVIARCLMPDPARRFHEAAQVARALEPSRSMRWWLAAAAAITLAAGVGAITYERSTAPRESIRLAFLPLEAAPDASVAANGVSRDAFKELARLKGGKRARLTVARLSAVTLPNADSTGKTYSISGATHVVHGQLSRDNGGFILHAFLTDTRTQADIADREFNYNQGELRYAPPALAGFVTAALNLPPLVVAPAVSGAAQAAYKAGLAVARQSGAVDESLELMRQAVAKDPDSPLPHAGLGEALWLKYRLTGDAAWLDLAKEQARQAGIRNPDLAAVHNLAGLLTAEAASAGWFVEAQTEYLRAIELDPDNSEAWRRLGDANEANNQMEAALAAFKRAVALAPRDLWSRQSLGAFYFDRANYAEAVQEFQRMVDLAPKDANARYVLGVADEHLGRLSDAEKELQASIGIEDSAKAEHELGYTYMLGGRYSDAILHYHQALKAPGPRTALLWLNLGVAYSLARQKEQAREAFSAGLPLAEKQLDANQTSGRFRAERAYLYAVLGKPQAESEAKAAARFSPNDKDTLWMAAATFEALGITNQSIQLLNDCPESMRPSLLSDLKRYPDMAGLHADRRFLEMVALYHVH